MSFLPPPFLGFMSELASYSLEYTFGKLCPLPGSCPLPAHWWGECWGSSAAVPALLWVCYQHLPSSQSKAQLCQGSCGGMNSSSARPSAVTDTDLCLVHKYAQREQQLPALRADNEHIAVASLDGIFFCIRLVLQGVENWLGKSDFMTSRSEKD